MDKPAAPIDDKIRQPSTSRYGNFAGWVLAPAVVAALLIAIIRLGATGQAARSPWSILLASFCVGLPVVAYADYTRQCRCLTMLVRSKSPQNQRGQRRLEAIIRASMEAVVIVDAAQCIVLFSPMAQVLFRYTTDDLAGQPVNRLTPLRFRAVHKIWVEQFDRTRSNERRMDSQQQIFALHIDGHELPIEASISHSERVGTKWYTIMLHDVGERMKANEAQMRLQERLHGLADSTLLTHEEGQRTIAGELQQGFGPRFRALHEATAGIAEQMQPVVLTGCQHHPDAIQISLEATNRSIRRICSNLCLQLLDDLGLMPAIQWIAIGFEWRYHITVIVSADTCELDGHSSIDVLRIVQEAPTNVTHHAQAPQAHMVSAQWAATVRYP